MANYDVLTGERLGLSLEDLMIAERLPCSSCGKAKSGIYCYNCGNELFRLIEKERDQGPRSGFFGLFIKDE